MRIYLDNCCYNRPFDGQEQLRVRLETEPRDYTKWRETHFCDDGETLEQLAEKIKAYVPPRRRPHVSVAKP